jgi:predicted RNA methylase
MQETNPWLPTPEPTDLCGRLMASLALMNRNGEADFAFLRETHAELLGCSVDEVDARIAADKATAKADKPARRTAAVPKAPPKAEALAPRAQGMRRLTDRQRDLLGLMRVDGQRAFVIVDGHVPDWADLKDTLMLLRATWKTSTKKQAGHFVFPEDVDAVEVVFLALDTGEVFDARLHGAFFTPVELADRLVAMAPLVPALPIRSLRVLEPSAGSGRLVDATLRAYPDAMVHCVELLAEHRAILTAAGHKIIGDDFLALTPDHVEPYDAVIGNPPFQRGTDRVHVLHASRFVRPGGVVSVIMSGSIAGGVSDTRSELLRRIVASHGGRIESVDAGAFAESGTMVRTALVTFTACDGCRVGHV